MSKLEQLLIYQDACLAISAEEAKLASTDARKRLQKLHAVLSELSRNKSAMQKFIDDNAALLASFEDSLDALQKRLDLELSEFDVIKNDTESTSAEIEEEARAFESLLGDIRALKVKIMDISETLSQSHERLKSILAKGAKAKKEYDALTAECEKERECKKDLLDELCAKRDECAKTVDAELLKRFIRIQKTHNDPVAMIADDKCGGCNMSLPTATVKKAKGSETVIECENCGRMLYCS